MRIHPGAGTDVGLAREHNEDAYLVAPPLFAVADGLGGHQGGEVASNLALETIEGLHRTLGDDLDLAEGIRRANEAVVERAAAEPGLAGMGTTLTMVRVEGDRISLAHVGDSRAYLLRDGELRLLTEDHTVVHRMVMEGRLTEQEAEAHPHRNVLTRALGVDERLAVDVGDHDLAVGDRLLLCSDGLTAMVPDQGILRILGERPDPQLAAEALVDAANTAGGVDNTTVIVLDVVEDDGSERADAGVDAAVAEGEAGEAPPPGPGPSERWRRAIVWVVGVTVVVVLGVVGVRLYIDRQWFVGVSDGRVALYRGIPTEVVGIDLFTLVEETDLPADEAVAAAAAWEGLEDGITADSEDEARSIIEQIEADVEAGRQDAA